MAGMYRQPSSAQPLTEIIRLVSIMLGHIRMSLNEAIDALLTIAIAVFPERLDEEPDLSLNAKNLKEAVENMLQVANVPLDTKMNDQRQSTGKCKV